MRSRFPQDAYLECNHLGEGPFSEKIIGFHNNRGEYVQGFVEGGKVYCVEEQDGIKSFLEVCVLEELDEGVKVRLPLADDTSITQNGRYQLINRRDLIYEEDFSKNDIN